MIFMHIERMMIHKCIILLILMIILISCTGCWDRRELEERISVVAVSIDRVEPSEDGKPMYLVSIQSPIPLKIAGGAEGSGGGGGAEAVE
jgi:spore germination protein KC